MFFVYWTNCGGRLILFCERRALDMCCNDKGFVNELSKEMNITEADAEFILMSQGVAGLYSRQSPKEADGQARALLAASTGHEDSRESGEKLWTANYMLDIA